MRGELHLVKGTSLDHDIDVEITIYDAEGREFPDCDWKIE